MSNKFSIDEDNFILDNYTTMAWQEIAESLNRSIHSVKGHARNSLHIKKCEPHEQWTTEEDEWLKEHYLDCGYIELAERFSKIFRPVSQHSLRSRATKYLNLKSGRQGFKKGQIMWNRRPIGYEQVNATSGYTYVKVADTGIKNKDYMAKHRLVYESVYGKLPEGYIVIFLDKNPSNFDIDNLRAIPRNVHAKMCQSGYYDDNAEFTDTALKLCSLEVELRNNNG